MTPLQGVWVDVLRFLLTNLLLPQLEKAAAAGEEARVLTCLAAGLGGNIDLDDLGCRDNKGLKAKADSGATYNDLMVKVIPPQDLSNWL